MKPTNAKFKVVIIDDEEDSCTVLRQALEEFPAFTVVGEAHYVKEAFQLIVKTKPDLLMLDVQMPGEDGFVLLEKLKEINFQPSVIFITAYNNYAIKAIKESALDYVLKPIDHDELDLALSKFLLLKEKQSSTENPAIFEKQGDKVFIRCKNGFLCVDASDLVYCEAEGNYTWIYMTENRKELICSSLPKTMELFQNTQWMRISRGVMINMHYLTKIDVKNRQCLLIRDNEIVRLKISVRQIRNINPIV